MTSFEPYRDDAAEDEFERNAATPAIPAKRPSRWAMTNWPVRWKVLAIVLVPLLLAGAFGGLRIYSGWTDAKDLRLAADRAEMVPAIDDYMASLEGALLANSAGGDAQSALSAFDTNKQKLQQRLAGTDVVPDVGSGVKSLLDQGQALLDKVTSNSISLRDRVTSYAPILLKAEDTITGSVRVDDAKIQADAAGLSRAVGARGQMLMQESLVNLGGELPEPELRASMITVAGTEPSTLFGMSQVLGVDSPEVRQLQGEFVKRMAMISDPAVPLVGNPDLLQSLETTNKIAVQIIANTSSSVTSAVEAAASDKRKEAIRDSAIVGAALLLALLIVLLVARSLVRPLRRLRDGALKVAHEDLVRELDVVRSGGDPGPIQLVPVHTSEEVGQVAHAVDELHEQAVLLAAEQARLQLQVSDMFETLSRRSRSLVDQQLSLIDRLEQNEEDPDRLESLFRLDHLAARMRRNGANLLVLAGTRVQREHAAPVAISTLVNAAASEVEDYARVVTESVPDDEVVGAVAGDLVHLLAELLDNALRYSPPTSRVRVSAIHTDHGGLVIEVTDAGLGMAESDMRVANTRLQSGGEVTPFTARHMGLFVVGRLASQHGLVVRLRSTVAGQPNSGTTAGIYVKAELLARGAASLEPMVPSHDIQGYDVQGYDVQGHDVESHDVASHDDERPDVPSYDIPDDPYGETADALAYAEDPTDYDVEDEPYQAYRNGRSEMPISLLPQRNPGFSGIAGVPLPFGHTADPSSGRAGERHEEPTPEKTADVLRPAVWQGHDDDSRQQVNDPPPPPPPLPLRSRNGEHPPEPVAWSEESAPPPPPAFAPPPPPPPPPAAVQASEPPVSGRAIADEDTNSIFDKMLSEWLIDDPVELAQSTDLDWKTVWDHGWSVASAAEEAPVSQHTESGLPVREPGARLVPGAADLADGTHDDAVNGGHRNGGSNNGGGHNGEGQRQDVEDAEPKHVVHRDPDAVRASMSSHFGGVRAGRAEAREAKGTEEE